MKKNSTKIPYYVEYKRYFRRMRSKLKLKILRGGKIPKRKLRKYNLEKTTFKKQLKFRAVKKWTMITVPKVFCFIYDHDTTFLFLDEVSKLLNLKKPKNLRFDHTKTELIGLSASFLFDSMIDKYKLKWKEKGYKIEMKGFMTSRNREVNNFILSFGLLSDHTIDGPIPENAIDIDYKTKYLTFKYSGNSQTGYMKSNGATGLAKYFRQCFEHNNYVLDSVAEATLIDAFGEIIGNAEEHSRKDGNGVFWQVLGCYNKSSSYCKFSIINYGYTIYQSLSDPQSTSAEVIKKVTEIVESNRSISEKIQDWFSKEDEEPVWNVMAIQDGISSKRTQQGPASTRGQGLMDVILDHQVFC